MATGSGKCYSQDNTLLKKKQVPCSNEDKVLYGIQKSTNCLSSHVYMYYFLLKSFRDTVFSPSKEIKRHDVVYFQNTADWTHFVALALITQIGNIRKSKWSAGVVSTPVWTVGGPECESLALPFSLTCSGLVKLWFIRSSTVHSSAYFRLFSLCRLRTTMRSARDIFKRGSWFSKMMIIPCL